MNVKRAIQYATVMLAALTQAGVAAAQCAPTQVPFFSENECAGLRFLAESSGFVSISFEGEELTVLQVDLRVGTVASAQGYDANGNKISSCFVEDDIEDIVAPTFGRRIENGCDDAVTRDLSGVGNPG